MLDSERTFKIKVRLRWTVFEILLMSAFCSTFDIQIDITLAVFREKLQDHTF